MIDTIKRAELLLDREFQVVRAAALRVDLLTLQAEHRAQRAARKEAQRKAAKAQQALTTKLNAELRQARQRLHVRVSNSLMTIKRIDKKLNASS